MQINWFLQVIALGIVHLLCTFIMLVFVLAWKDKHSCRPNRTIAKGAHEEGPEFTSIQNETYLYFDNLMKYALPKAFPMGLVLALLIVKFTGVLNYDVAMSYTLVFMGVLLAVLFNLRSAH